MKRGALLVVAGEPSGDRAIGSVLRSLGGEVRAFGFGGDAMAAAGAELLAHVRDVSGMGLVELVSRGPNVARALAALRREVDARAPTHALLASWSAANARIGCALRERGVHVTWISPPEIWAWGASRAASLVHSADRFALTLPFEPPMWRRAGADAGYVGHPALDVAVGSRASLRRRLGLGDRALVVGVLPGSRPSEVRALAPTFLAAARLLRASIGAEARLVVAPDLPRALVDSLRRDAAAHAIETLDAPIDAGAIALLPAFDVALVASGTASLECALAGVPPVVAYRMHPITFAIARRVVTTPYVALPNAVLARAVFRERVQRFDAEMLARDLRATLDAHLGDECARVRERMTESLDGRSFAERVASLLSLP